MNESTEATATQTSIKGFMLTAVLILPLGFFLWFYLSALLVMPTQWVLEWLLRSTIGDPVHDVVRNVYLLGAELLIDPPPGMSGSGQAVAELTLNPMIYGYGLALVGGLIFCVPLHALQRLIQLLVTFLVVTGVQIWGCYWELMKDLALNRSLGEDGLKMVDQAGINHELIAFCYQFGYLVLPAVIPVVVWIILNRRFIEGLVQPGVFARR